MTHLSLTQKSSSLGTTPRSGKTKPASQPEESGPKEFATLSESAQQLLGADSSLSGGDGVGVELWDDPIGPPPEGTAWIRAVVAERRAREQRRANFYRIMNSSLREAL